MDWIDLFPPHRLVKDKFLTILKQLHDEKNPDSVIKYWKYLADEGTMYNILYALDPADHWHAEVLIYSMAEFLDRNSYESLKQMLQAHGHILEFVFAMTTTPPNLGVVEYFVRVAKSPRHHSPRIVKWFLQTASQSLNDKLTDELAKNCIDAVCRWILTQKKKKPRRQKKLRDASILNDLVPIHVPPGVYSSG